MLATNVTAISNGMAANVVMHVVVGHAPCHVRKTVRRGTCMCLFFTNFTVVCRAVLCCIIISEYTVIGKPAAVQSRLL